MAQDVIIAGYQGPRSILTRGLSAFAEVSLPSATLVPDVTANGVSAQDLFTGLETGDYQVGYMASGYLTSQVPELGVLDIPFSVADRARAHERLDGAAGKQLAAAVRAGTGLEVLGFWDNGFRHVTNGVLAIRTPADCRGLRVRTLNNQLYQDTMAAIGFEPVVTDVKELIEACESGRVDAQENPLTNMLTFGLDQWHRHVSLTAHIFGVVLLVAHRPWFDGLNPGEKSRIQVGARQSTILQRSLAAEEDEAGLSVLGARGVEILPADKIDLDAFRRAAQPVRERALARIPGELAELYLS